MPPTHQYPWSEWQAAKDGRENGIYVSYRKGDNSFSERGHVYLRFYNRYKGGATGSLNFDIVNQSSGEKTSKTNYFSLKSEQKDEDGGLWHIVPGYKEDPQHWASLRVTLQNLEVKSLNVKK